MSLNSHFLSCRPDSLLFPQLQSVLWDRASVRVGEQHAPRQEERRNHEALERVSRSVNTIVLNLTTSLIVITLLLRCHLQPTVDGGRLQQCRRLSLQVLRPLALQAVPRRRGGQRRRSQRHLCQLERIRPGGCERQLPVRLTGGTREKGRKSCTFLSSCLWGGKKQQWICWKRFLMFEVFALNIKLERRTQMEDREAGWIQKGEPLLDNVNCYKLQENFSGENKTEIQNRAEGESDNEGQTHTKQKEIKTRKHFRQWKNVNTKKKISKIKKGTKTHRNWTENQAWVGPVVICTEVVWHCDYTKV